MDIKAKCPSCGTKGLMGRDRDFHARGKFNGYPAFMCASCKTGVFVSNAGRAMITKRAKTKLIPKDAWASMSAQWNQQFPNG